MDPPACQQRGRGQPSPAQRPVDANSRANDVKGRSASGRGAGPGASGRDPNQQSSYFPVGTRTTPDSPREITDPKRRLTNALLGARETPEVLNKDPPDIDSLEALFRSIPPLERLPVGPLSPIDRLIDNISIKRLADILVNSDELVEKAKAAKQILDDGSMNSDQGVEKLSSVVREFWLSECFVNGVHRTMEDEDMIGPVVQYANQDSARQRWKLMKEDPLFKPSLTSLDSAAATNTDIMRLFLSILIGYWGDKAVLMNLDDAMGKAVFGFWLSIVAREREKLAREKGKHKLYVEKREIKNFIYFFKDGDNAKDLKHVQQWLVSTYGNDKNVNTDALLEEIESELTSRLEISRRLFNGRRLFPSVFVWEKARIHIRVVDGLYATLSVDCDYY